jgi:LytS/YehU family sensor histidine kinase
MLSHPYLENAIKHNIMPLQNDGRISVHFKEEKNVLICSVKDNGVGREQAAIKKKNLELHLGKSAQITETRLELLSRSGNDVVPVEFIDLKANDNKASGTEVILRFE